MVNTRKLAGTVRELLADPATGNVGSPAFAIIQPVLSYGYKRAACNCQPETAMVYRAGRRQAMIEIERTDNGLQEGLNNAFNFDDFRNCGTCSGRYQTSNPTRVVEASNLIIVTLKRDGEDLFNRSDIDLDDALNLPLVTGGNQQYRVIAGIEHFGSLESGLSLISITF